MSKYKFRFGEITDWLFKTPLLLQEAQGARRRDHNILYIYKNGSLNSTLLVTNVLYKCVCDALIFKYREILPLCLSEPTITHVIRILPVKIRSEAWEYLEQEYLKHALNDHQAAAIAEPAGTENAQSSD